MKKLLIGFSLSLLTAGAAWAQTNVAGGNLTTQTWTLAGSPYIVSGDCVVTAGQTLTIEAGVQVRFTNSDGQLAGLDTARVELTIQGSLAVNGAAGNAVVFEAQTGTAAATWYGIVVSAGGNASVTHATLRHGVNGLTRIAGGGTFSLSNSTFTLHSGYGARIEGFNGNISDLSFSASPTGLWVFNPGITTVFNSAFTGHTTAGLRASNGIINVARATFSGNAIGFWGDKGGGTVANGVFSNNTLGAKLVTGTGEDWWLVHSSFSHNPAGVEIGPASGDLIQLHSCIFAFATTAVKRMPGDAATIWSSALLFWSNGTDLDGVTSTPTYTGNPNFVAAPGDLHLSAGSAALSRGPSALPFSSPDRDGQVRPQGAGRDLGAYEFVAGANDAPVLGPIGARSTPELSTLAFTIAATDPDGEPPTYSATGLPAGATLDPATGAFSWTPAAGDMAGSPYSVIFTASDGVLDDSETVSITVTQALAGGGGGGGGGGCGLSGLEGLALLALLRSIAPRCSRRWRA